jgi:hypothetical protein
MWVVSAAVSWLAALAIELTYQALQSKSRAAIVMHIVAWPLSVPSGEVSVRGCFLNLLRVSPTLSQPVERDFEHKSDKLIETEAREKKRKEWKMKVLDSLGVGQANRSREARRVARRYIGITAKYKHSCNWRM